MKPSSSVLPIDAAARAQFEEVFRLLREGEDRRKSWYCSTGATRRHR